MPQIRTILIITLILQLIATAQLFTEPLLHRLSLRWKHGARSALGTDMISRTAAARACHVGTRRPRGYQQPESAPWARKPWMPLVEPPAADQISRYLMRQKFRTARRVPTAATGR